jgi:phosphatidylglycerophosphatase A
MNRMIVWVAQGLGIGRIPVAPGTFGSVLGILYFIGLVATGPILFSLLAFLGIFVSVAFCGAAEKIMGEKDPGSVVIDEIIALPICFATWVSIFWSQHQAWPSAGYFVSSQNWPITVGIFVLFRLFDVWKPWPVRQSQDLPGGWGVTIDDVLAAGYVNLAFVIYYLLIRKTP